MACFWRVPFYNHEAKKYKYPNLNNPTPLLEPNIKVSPSEVAQFKDEPDQLTVMQNEIDDLKRKAAQNTNIQTMLHNELTLLKNELKNEIDDLKEKNENLTKHIHNRTIIYD